MKWLVVAGLVGCSNSTSNPDSGTNGCEPTDFVDATQDPNPQIQWTFTVSPPCIAIHPNQSVTWVGDFSMHPLATFGGDSPNPIGQASLDAGSTTVVFPTAGTFGFHCLTHPSMLGAVRVAP